MAAGIDEVTAKQGADMNIVIADTIKIHRQGSRLKGGTKVGE